MTTFDVTTLVIEVDHLRNEVKRHRKQLAAAREALESVEWVHDQCPWCGGSKWTIVVNDKDMYNYYHKDNCLRQAALAAMDSK